ncbi:uncharacterized protein A4U43_C06F16930 [Asparagus officinalis]|uniref:ribonuclease Z n=1 Tax=Asparagus officinalis TaxID=4686 RepID=A0A5P1EPW1_ASPOF|nr:uncharacterized protein A4U43_C06F16930 [Asparagus officinalis]
MLHISSLKLLSSTPLLKLPFSSPSSLFFNPKTPSKLHHSHFTVLSYYSRRDRRKGRGGSAPQRRGRSTITEVEMEEKKEAMGGFNKRRAEGRDAGGKRRNLQQKVQRLNPVSTICYVQGLQRFCTEHKIKLSKIDHIFLTRVCSETAGGLPGLLLTLAGIGEEGMSVNMWGPSDLKYLVDAMKSFIPHAAMVCAHSFGETQDKSEVAVSFPDTGRITDPIVLIDDEVVRLSAIPLRPSQSNNGSTLKPGDIAVVYVCELPEIKGKFDPVKASSLGRLKPGPKYRELQLGKSVMSDYQDIMVQPSDVLGPSVPGPIVLIVDCPTSDHMLELFSLQSLECYYVDSTDHKGEGIKHVNCVIHMSPASVTRDADYQKWMRMFGITQHIMAGHEIKNMEIPILKASARISSRLNYLCPPFFPAPGFWSLNNINFFPHPNGSCEEPSPDSGNQVSAENLLKFHLRPYAQLGLDRSAIPSLLNHKDIVDELLSEIPEIVDISKYLRQFWTAESKSAMCKKAENITMVEEPWINEALCSPNSKLELLGSKEHLNATEKNSDIPPCLENITREDMEFILLGTGSSQPSKYRNVSSIFVNLFSKGGLLLDCGEGTLAQLKRRFGVEGADSAVKDLRFIWISHIHADHHTGLARILALRSRLLKDVPHEPLLVIGPRPLKRFLDAYSRLEDLDMQFLDCRHTTEASLDPQKDNHKPLQATLFAKGSRMESYWNRPGSPVDTAVVLPLVMRLKSILHDAGLEALYSVPVIHCPQAFGVVLKAAERKNNTGKAIPGWKLVYSGDTRPCQSLIDASSGATVLIHEATFEDGMDEEAITKNHSTTKEAIAVGASAGAYRVVLTHFSQRYPKVPVFDEVHMDRTCIAFDLMSVNAADLHVLPKVLPYLKVLFRNEMSIDESDEVLDVAVQQ